MSFRDLTEAALGRCLDAFGESAEYRPSAEDADPYSIKGIFSDEFIELDVTSGAQIVSRTPNLGVRLSDFETGDPKKGDTVFLTRTATEYKVVKVQRDGEVGAVLVLSKV